jgi:hypothetical protein
MYYDSEALYVNSKTTAQARIVAIDVIIDGLLTSATNSIGNADMQTYQLNDGQTEIKMSYRSLDQITDAIKNWRALQNMFRSDINPRQVRLMDVKNLYTKYFTR